MRKDLFSLMMTFLVLGTTITGCFLDDSPSSPSVTPELLAYVNGSAWNAGMPTATRVVPPSEVTMVGAKGSDVLTINVGAGGPGTYNVGDASGAASAILKWNNDEYTTSRPGCSGHVVVDKFDEAGRLFSGVFNFIAKNADGDSIVVTNGKFSNVHWSEQ